MTSKHLPRKAFLQFTDEPGEDLEGARRLPLDLIDANPHQPRQVFDAAADAELAQSVAQDGVIEPVIVRPHPADPARYLLVAGERRTRAARAAGLTSIPAIIREDLDDTSAYLLTVQENLQRASLDIEDEGRQFEALLGLTGLSQRGLAERLGINHNYLSRRVRLLRRPDLLAAYRAGARGLLETVNLIDAPPDTPGVSQRYSDEGASPAGIVFQDDDDGDDEPVSQRYTGPQLVERTPPPATPHPPPATGPRTLPWRRRPLDEFAAWIGRTPPESVPRTERAAVRRQATELQTWLERWVAGLADDEDA